jgi:plastocyanin
MQIHARSVRMLAFATALLLQNAAWSAESFTLVIKDHRFDPAVLEVPSGQKFKLVVRNEDSTSEEFESKSLKREKIVPGRSQVTLSIGPLEPGTHEFFGEFHEATAKGRIVAK